MKVISNAFLNQVEILQLDRWEYGPLELVLVPDRQRSNKTDYATEIAIHDWNQSQSGGFLRSGESLERLKTLIPSIEARRNPNMLVVPTRFDGVSQLDVMLAELLPDKVLQEVGVERKPALLNMASFGLYELPDAYGSSVRAAFSSYIWKKLAPRARLSASAFFCEVAIEASRWGHELLDASNFPARFG